MDQWRWGAVYGFPVQDGHRFTRKVTSSDKGRVLWMELDKALDTNWIWGMNDLMRIFRDGMFAELFLDLADGWKQVLK